MKVGIEAIEYYLPEKCLSNEAFSHLGVDQSFMKEKVGIEKRFISGENEGVSDMAVKAAEKLFGSHNIDPARTRALVLCTQNPDYVLPTTACIVQDRLKIPKSSMCFDVNLGCSGFVYSLGIAAGLINTFGFENVLVITSEAYSKVISYQDKTTATIFSDGAAATFVVHDAHSSHFVSFNFGTDGGGYKNLIVPVSGSKRQRTAETSALKEYSPGVKRSEENLFMDGHEITKFVFKEIPNSIKEILQKSNIELHSIDRFFFHQASKYMLESLVKRMNLPAEKVYIDLSRGNTVSSTIPIALRDHYNNGTNLNETVLISGFGVGYSWACSILNIQTSFGGS